MIFRDFSFSNVFSLFSDINLPEAVLGRKKLKSTPNFTKRKRRVSCVDPCIFSALLHTQVSVLLHLPRRAEIFSAGLFPTENYVFSGGVGMVSPAPPPSFLPSPSRHPHLPSLSWSDEFSSHFWSKVSSHLGSTLRTAFFQKRVRHLRKNRAGNNTCSRMFRSHFPGFLML